MLLVDIEGGLRATATRAFGDSTRSSLFQRQAKAWLAECRTRHPQCNSLPVERFYPTRLVDLRNRGDIEPSVRVIETDTLIRSLQYATLSYCWGMSQSFILKPSSYEELRSPFSVQRLPKTFRDAIEVCRWFHIDYL